MTLDGATVLVVDDELVLLEIFRSWLEREGCRVLSAANGAEALEVLRVERVDAVLSDIRMPVMDGMTLARQVHSLGHEAPPIVLVSGSSDLYLSEARSLGVAKVLEKPLRRAEMIDVLQHAFEQARVRPDRDSSVSSLPAASRPRSDHAGGHD